jgi:Pyruvate/2-oxoacid:ferredoxin oxidoreductase gamma subunit
MVNSSLVDKDVFPAGKIRMIKVPAAELAAAAGNERMANLAMLGAFFAETNIIDYSRVTGQLTSFLPAHKKNLAAGFKEALQQGKHYIESQL